MNRPSKMVLRLNIVFVVNHRFFYIREHHDIQKYTRIEGESRVGDPLTSTVVRRRNL